MRVAGDAREVGGFEEGCVARGGEGCGAGGGVSGVVGFKGGAGGCAAVVLMGRRVASRAM